MPSLTLELNQKIKLNVFEQIFKHSLNFEPLPPLISGLNSKFDYATLCVLNHEVWLAKISFLESYLYQTLSRKNIWSVGSTTLRSGRVKRVAKNNSWNNGDRHKIHEIFLIVLFSL